MHTQQHHRRTAAVLATALLLAPAMAACGSDSGEASADGGKETIKVMTYGPTEAQGFSLPQIAAGAQAGVDKVNAEGGIDGRKLELIVCNDNNDPNTAAGCARQAVQDEVVAIVGGYSAFEAQVNPIVEKAGIPIIGNTPISEFTSTNLFPFTGGAASVLFAVASSLAANPECAKTVGVVIEDFAATRGAAQLFELGVRASGAEFTGISGAPQGTSDFAPAVAAAAANTGCIGIIAGPQTAPSIASAATSNADIKVVGTTDSILTSDAVKKLGPAAEGIISAADYLPLTADSDVPEIAEFVERSTKIDPDFAPDQIGASSYLAPLVLAEALQGATDITPQTITEGLNEIKGYDTKLGPVIDFTSPNPTKAFARLPLASPLYQFVVADGAYTLATEDTLDISTIYQAAASQQ